MQKQQFELNKERGLGEKIEFTFNFWKANFNLLFKLALSICIPFIVIGTSLSSFSKLYLYESEGLQGAVNFLGIIVNCIGVFNLVALSLSFLKIHNDPNLQLTYGNVKYETKNNFKKIFKGNIAYGIATTLGFLLLVFPGIYVAIAWSIIVPIMVLEDLETKDSISRAGKLMSGNWWSTFIFLFVFGLIIGIVNFLFGSLPLILSELLPMLGGSNSAITSILIMTFTIISGFISPIFVILYQFGNGIHYFSLKEQKEATSILNEVEAMS